MNKRVGGALAAGLVMLAGAAGAQNASVDVEAVAPTVFKRQGEEVRVYSAKVICGVPGDIDDPVPFSADGPDGTVLAPGLYLTAINIHNPDPDNRVTLTKKVVEAPPERIFDRFGPGRISVRRQVELGPDEAFEVDCPDALALLRGRSGGGDGGEVEAEAIPTDGFLKGFVVIETRGRPNQSPPLDVVGVYTVTGDRTGGDGGSGTIEVTGVLTDEGAECPVLRGDDGTLYALTGGNLDGLQPGDRVRVVGRVVEFSVCIQDTTLAVERIEALP